MKRTVSLFLAWAFLAEAVTGIVLYVDPPGRIAYWGGWSLLGLDKEQWGALHTVFGFFMVTAAAFHIYFNWRPLVSYMKDRVTRTLTATRELTVATGLFLAVALGTGFALPPFSWIVQLGEEIGESWEKGYGTPPFSHAELATVEQFCQRMGLDPLQALETLEKEGIRPGRQETFKTLAKRIGRSPQELYDLIRTAQGKPAVLPTSQEGSGMGRKTLSQVCELRGIPLETARERLERAGLSADPDRKFREIAEEAGMMPFQLLELLEGK